MNRTAEHVRSPKLARLCVILAISFAVAACLGALALSGPNYRTVEHGAKFRSGGVLVNRALKGDRLDTNPEEHRAMGQHDRSRVPPQSSATTYEI